jgi:hypothetical protein
MPPKAKQTAFKRITRQKTLAELAMLTTTLPRQCMKQATKQVHPCQPTAQPPTPLTPPSPTTSFAPSASSSSLAISNTSPSPTTSSPPTSPTRSESSPSQPTQPSTSVHKTINPKSTNRRQCKRASDNLSRSTPDCNNLSQRKYTHSTRLTLKMNCPASDNTENKLISLFTQFIGELVSVDPTAAVLPWKSIHQSKGNLSKSADIPTDTRLLQPYLNKFFISRTPDSQFITYPGVHIGHNMSLPEIREEIQPWLQEGNHRLDYTSNPNRPTLRQMIMSLKATNDAPLFHFVDLDWRGDGFIFQYSPDIKIEAECTINTLLPILRHKFLDTEVDKNFSKETIEKCEGCKFDPEKGVVVDTLVDDNITFIDEENLLGFSFSTAIEEDQPTLTRPDQPQALFNDSNSVSTLAKPGTSVITPAISNNINFSRFEPRSSDNTSVTSSMSTVTMDTVHSIENRLSSLTTQLHNNDKKFEEIMQFLRASQAGGNISSATSTIGTSQSGQPEAGDNQPIFGSGP